MQPSARLPIQRAGLGAGCASIDYIRPRRIFYGARLVPTMVASAAVPEIARPSFSFPRNDVVAIRLNLDIDVKFKIVTHLLLRISRDYHGFKFGHTVGNTISTLARTLNGAQQRKGQEG